MSSSIQLARPLSLRRSGLAPTLALVGLAVALASSFADPQRAWAAWLVAAFAVLTVGLGGAVFVALLHVTGARWSDRILVVPQRLSALVPVGAALLLALGAGVRHLYPWADASRVAHDPVLNDRSTWMAPFAVGLRMVLFGLLWTWAARRLAARSRRAVLERTVTARQEATRAGALFLVLFAPTFSVTCFDLLLSLEAHWSSTMLAWLQFAGLLEASTAVVVLGVLAARRAGKLAVDADVLHDLGRLLFAFAFFWGYLWFCQWMLIWYTNMPEETAPYALRHAGAWQPLALANVLLGFAAPFLLLLSRHGKRNATVLGRAAVVALLGRWLDLLLAVQPTVLGARPALGLVELATACGAVGVVAWLGLSAPGSAPQEAPRMALD